MIYGPEPDRMIVRVQAICISLCDRIRSILSPRLNSGMARHASLTPPSLHLVPRICVGHQVVPLLLSWFCRLPLPFVNCIN